MAQLQLTQERNEQQQRNEREAAAATMASGGMKREISETHDALRFGINAGVKADLAPPHPLQSTIQSVRTHLSPLFSFTFPCRRNPNAESRCLGHALPHRRPNSGRTRKSSGRRPSTDPPSTSARISMPKSSPGSKGPLVLCHHLCLDMRH